MPKQIAGLKVYTVEEVAKELGVTAQSVYTYIQDGRLIAQKYGRSWNITEANLQAFVSGPIQYHHGDKVL